MKNSDIKGTETEFRDGVKHTTHYVNRPIRQGDPHGGEVGMNVNGVNTVTEIVNYIYESSVKKVELVSNLEETK